MTEKEYVLPVDKIVRFKLSQQFLDEYKGKRPNWGFGALSYVTFKRTYAREVEGEDRTEEWWETCTRVIEGMFTVQKAHCKAMGLPWDNRKAQRSAQEAYERLFEFKWSPPGRGLWAMGTEFVYERGGAALNNCAFVSTENIDMELAEPFVWNFTMSMYGVGVGFDTLGAGKVQIIEPKVADEPHVVADSREGWADAIRRVINAYSGKGALPKIWDYSEVRPKGIPIKGFGGVSSGPEPLEKAIQRIDELMRSRIGQKITEADIVDIMNICGACVVAGGIRRTAQIAFGNSDEFMDLKLDKEKLYAWRWASNNSIFAEVGQDYTEVARRTAVNGEPGYAWLDNMRAYGRMKDEKNYKDYRASGGNPCLEQTLEDHELCCLVETYPVKHDDLQDFMRTLKYAYLYAKTVTLIPTHDTLTNAVMMRNRRIGCSQSGIVQNIEKIGLRAHQIWSDKGYGIVQQWDKKYSEWFCVPRSIKTTSVKPSGTVSILAGVTPGIHAAHSQYLIRRIRIATTSPLWEHCRDAGYQVEPDKYSDNTMVVSFPLYDPLSNRTKKDFTIWEQVSLAAMLQHYWADNQVSCTVNFQPEEADQIKLVLEHFQDRLKGISFLPNEDHGYEQAPYEEITKEEYEEMIKSINYDYDFNQVVINHDKDDKFCDGDTCQIDFSKMGKK